MANVMKFYGFEFSSASHTAPELSGSGNCFKYAIGIANLLFLVFGIVLCAVGGYAMTTKAGGLAGQSLPTGIIVLGVFIILVSLLGCGAAFRESRCMLALYFGLLFIFTFILFFVGIAVYVKKDQAEYYITQGWCYASAPVISDLQKYENCCGLYNYDDSIATNSTPAGCGLINPTAFDNKHVQCPDGSSASNTLPCLPILKDLFASSYQSAGAAAIAFAVIMGVGLIIVCVLMSAIKQKRHLEEVRALHRKLREAKEDPAHAGMRGVSVPGGVNTEVDDTGYGEVDLNAADPSSVSHQEPLDTDVHINVGGNTEVEQEAETNYPPGTSTTFKAQLPKKTKKSTTAAAATTTAGSKRGKRQPEPVVDEQPYEEEDSYQPEETGGQHGSRYTHRADEYDEED